MSVVTLNLKFQGIRKARFRTCPFINKLRKMSFLTSTEHHKQDDSAYGKYEIQFRNNENTM